jgi:hypothetical protein
MIDLNAAGPGLGLVRCTRTCLLFLIHSALYYMCNMYVYINPIVSSEDEKAKKLGEERSKKWRLFSSSDVESFANTISRARLEIYPFQFKLQSTSPRENVAYYTFFFPLLRSKYSVLRKMFFSFFIFFLFYFFGPMTMT